MKKRFRTCCLCGREYFGYGNNANPVCDGECCDICNNNIVIPARILDNINEYKMEVEL